MALRRRDNKQNKNGRASAGQTSSGRTRGARAPGFYDLRGQDRGSAGTPAGEPAADERPYRERHRVEVRPADRDRQEELYAGRYSAGPDADLFSPVRGSGRPDRWNNVYRGQGPDLHSVGRSPAEPRRRVVRGNSPGERRGGYSIPGGSTPERSPERRQDLSADLFVPQRAGQNSGGSYGTADLPSWRQRAAENRRAYSGSGTRPVRRADIVSSYREDRSFRERHVRSEGGADSPEERQYGSGTGRRESRRRQLRREREKQLRRTYMKIGAGMIAIILILVLVVHAVSGLLRRGRKAEEQAESMAAAQVTAEASAREQDGSAEDSGEESELSEAETGQTASENNTDQSSGSGEENPPEGDSAQPQETETDLNGEEENSTLPETTDPEGVQTPSAEQAEAAGTASAVSGESGAEQTYVDREDWRLILVNPFHPLPENYNVETKALPNGESVDSRCFQALTDMLEDCRAAGGTPIVCSSYRPHEKQVKLFEDQVASLTAKGMSREEAEKEAGTVVAVPGTSEHELGLAVDICDTYNQLLDSSQADTRTQQWLMLHCWEYGFILRYPENKSDITGIIYEPWHYRYVGPEAAAQIRDRGICLEEYLAQN